MEQWGCGEFAGWADAEFVVDACCGEVDAAVVEGGCAKRGSTDVAKRTAKRMKYSEKDERIASRDAH